MSAAQEKYSLIELSSKAIEFSKILKSQELRAQQRAKSVQQAWANIGPEISAQAEYLKQDPTGSGEESSGTREFRRSTQTSAKLSLSQTLFQGFSEYYSIRRAQALKAAESARVQGSRSELLLELSNLFYTILALENSHLLLKEQLELTSKRVAELEEWEKIGRSKKSDLLSARAQQAILRSQQEALLQTLAEMRSLIPVLTGLSSDIGLQSNLNMSMNLESLDFYMKRLSSRGDVKAAQESLKVAQFEKKSAFSEHLPRLDAKANYYLKRSGVYDKVDWDFSLQLSIPLFSSGRVLMKQDELALREKEQEVLLHQRILEARQQVEALYAKLVRAETQLELLEKAKNISEASYSELQEDYKRGLATNLEVLEALNTFIESKRRWIEAVFDKKRLFAQLQLASGGYLEDH